MPNYHESLLGYAFLSSTLSSDTALQGYAPGGVHRGLAPSGAAAPFVIMVHQAGSDSVTMNGFRMLVESLYQVKVVGPASLTTTLALAAARIDRLLGSPPGVPASGAVVVNGVTEGQVLACYRQAPLALDELVNGEVWSNFGGLYRMLIEQIAS